MASGGSGPGETILFLRRPAWCTRARSGCGFPRAPRLTTLVSQGCRPFGASFVVTRARDNFLLELGGRPPLERLEEALSSLVEARPRAGGERAPGRPRDRRVQERARPGRLPDPRRAGRRSGLRRAGRRRSRRGRRERALPRPRRGDRRRRAAVAVAGTVAELAGRAGRRAAVHVQRHEGRVCFPKPITTRASCPRALGGAALAGFFCAGEFGPVGGRNFLHGFTASLAIFVDGPSA